MYILSPAADELLYETVLTKVKGIIMYDLEITTLTDSKAKLPRLLLCLLITPFAFSLSYHLTPLPPPSRPSYNLPPGVGGEGKGGGRRQEVANGQWRL